MKTPSLYNSNQEAEWIETGKRYLTNNFNDIDVELLREILRFHEWKYYVDNKPVVSDYEYDQLFNRLKELEKRSPEIITPDSPTQRVSSDITEEFNTVSHIVPMLSLDNSYDSSDLKKFDEQLHKLTSLPLQEAFDYCVEPKFDGGSIALVYENDLFIRSATRGNGFEGEDISANAKTLPSVPLKARFSKYGIFRAEIRGEAVIPKEIFKSMNEERFENGLSLFANPRNTAAGGLRVKNPLETRDRGIEVFAFHLVYAVNQLNENMLTEFPDHKNQIELLRSLGFKTADPVEMKCMGIEEVIEKSKKWEEARDLFPYEIDGMVVKLSDYNLQQLCGSTTHHPRWAIAYKFKAKQAITRLIDVEYQVGKVGSITPVAKVEPVFLAGVTVSSISLHNEEFINARDLRIGDQIVIERAGDVIPYVVKSLAELRKGNEQPIRFPQYCPINNSEKVILKREEGEAAWRCPACNCGAQNLQKMIFHVSKDAMDIDGFGKAYIERFHELGWLKDMSDIYNLDYEKIAKLEGFGIKSAQNLRKAVDKAKNNSLSNFLHSLGIHHLGKKASKLLAENIKSVYELLSWKSEDYTNIKDIGPVVASNVSSYFSQAPNVEMIRRMESYGVNVFQSEDDKPKVNSGDSPLNGKTILFTGSLGKMTRDEAQMLAESRGAKNISAVSSKLNILVVGENAGSKLTKAQNLGTVQIITEEEFLELIQ